MTGKHDRTPLDSFVTGLPLRTPSASDRGAAQVKPLGADPFAFRSVGSKPGATVREILKPPHTSTPWLEKPLEVEPDSVIVDSLPAKRRDRRIKEVDWTVDRKKP